MQGPSPGQRAQGLVTQTPESVELVLRGWLAGPVRGRELWLKRIQLRLLFADHISAICGWSHRLDKNRSEGARELVGDFPHTCFLSNPEKWAPGVRFAYIMRGVNTVPA